MYLNTLICLEENIAGYGKNNTKPSGHVTITSPGIVKCYVQNLRPMTKPYTMYLISKNQNKAIRLGPLNPVDAEKQTTWQIDLKDVKGSGVQGKDIDSIAIVVEGDSIGNTDTVMMGFSNGKYLVSSMLESAIPKKVMPASTEVKPEPKVEIKIEPKVEPKVEPKTEIKVEASPVEQPSCGCSECQKDDRLSDEDYVRAQVEALLSQPRVDAAQAIEDLLHASVHTMEINTSINDGDVNAVDEEQQYLSQIEAALKNIQEDIDEDEAQKKTILPSTDEPLDINSRKNDRIRVREIFMDSTPLEPFEEKDTATDWVRISMAELISMPQFSYEWCTNPFVTYCYHKFGFLILGRDKEIEQYYLGIPDVFDSRRNLISTIDKIEQFRGKDSNKPSAGDYGYWIVRI